MKNKFCPQCNSKNILPILYGEPSTVTDTMYFGGCVIEDNSPSYNCSDCKCQWGKVKMKISKPQTPIKRTNILLYE